jgi:acetylornithine deacetylase
LRKLGVLARNFQKRVSPRGAEAEQKGNDVELDRREKQIIAAVDGFADDIVDFTCRLVGQASTLGNEAGAMAVFRDRLRELGFSPVDVPMNTSHLASHPGFAPVSWPFEEKVNVVAVCPAEGQGGQSLLLNGHLDVVSAEPLDLWDSDPFFPHIEDGWLYGRGAGDMKSGVAAMVFAIYAIQRAGFGLGAPVTLEAVVEEECSGNGALACLAAGYDADAVLIPEPFGPTVLTDQVGVLWFKVNVHGSPRHVLEAQAGTNAIEKSYLLISALRRLEAELNREDIPEAYRGMAHPLNLNIGIIKGGDWPSTVAAAAEFHCRLSYFPGTGYDTICRRIRDTLAEAAKQDDWLSKNPPEVIFYGFRSDGHSIDRSLPAMELLSGCHQTISGQPAASYISTCTTDLRAFHFFGHGQATCFGPVAERIHGANERVDVQSVMHVARTYALFAARWCQIVE